MSITRSLMKNHADTHGTSRDEVTDKDVQTTRRGGDTAPYLRHSPAGPVRQNLQCCREWNMLVRAMVIAAQFHRLIFPAFVSVGLIAFEAQAAPLTFQSQEPRTALLELYTSEGC